MAPVPCIGFLCAPAALLSLVVVPYLVPVSHFLFTGPHVFFYMYTWYSTGVQGFRSGIEGGFFGRSARRGRLRPLFLEVEAFFLYGLPR